MLDQRIQCPACDASIAVSEPDDAGRSWDQACPFCGATFRLRRADAGPDDGDRRGSGFEVVDLS